MRRLRNFFVTGLIVLIPVITSVLVLRFLFNVSDGVLGPLISRLIGVHVPGIGVVAGTIIIMVTGALATNYFGSRIIRFAETALIKMPVVRGIYLISKQIVDAFFQPETTPFKKVCMVEYPRKGMFTIGFVTRELSGEADSEPVVSIFIAATPNPTFGFYIMVPRSEVTYLDLTVDEGLKMVVSGGIIVPPGMSAVFQKKCSGLEQA
jgi:uncharacterized membrane protein